MATLFHSASSRRNIRRKEASTYLNTKQRSLGRRTRPFGHLVGPTGPPLGRPAHCLATYKSHTSCLLLASLTTAEQPSKFEILEANFIVEFPLTRVVLEWMEVWEQCHNLEVEGEKCCWNLIKKNRFLEWRYCPNWEKNLRTRVKSCHILARIFIKKPWTTNPLDDWLSNG
jgi:hypothetical protein